MDNNGNSTKGSIGLLGLTLLWGIITQALTWAGVLSWSWMAIWGPLLIVVAIELVALVVCGLVLLIAYILDSR